MAHAALAKKNSLYAYVSVRYQGSVILSSHVESCMIEGDAETGTQTKIELEGTAEGESLVNGPMWQK